MKLKNKKTGEIWTLTNRNEGTSAVLWVSNGSQTHVIESIEELANNFEDYKEPKEHWTIGHDGAIFKLSEWENQKDHEEIGNYFETKEEAEKAVEKLKAWKRLKNKGFQFESWWGGSKDISFWVDTEIDVDMQDDLDLLFGGEE